MQGWKSVLGLLLRLMAPVYTVSGGIPLGSEPDGTFGITLGQGLPMPRQQHLQRFKRTDEQGSANPSRFVLPLQRRTAGNQAIGSKPFEASTEGFLGSEPDRSFGLDLDGRPQYRHRDIPKYRHRDTPKYRPWYHEDLEVLLDDVGLSHLPSQAV
jgi:hypothetical protein